MLAHKAPLLLLTSLLLLGPADAELDFLRNPSCSSVLSTSFNLTIQETFYRSVLLVDVIHVLRVGLKDEPASVDDPVAMRDLMPEATIGDRAGTTWETLGSDYLGVEHETVPPSNETNYQTYVLSYIRFRQRFRASGEKMLRNATAEQCELRMAAKFKATTSGVNRFPGCTPRIIITSMSESAAAHPGVADKLTKKEDDLDILLYTKDLSRCSLSKLGDFCNNVYFHNQTFAYIDSLLYLGKQFLPYSFVPTVLAAILWNKRKQRGEAVTSSDLFGTIFHSNLAGIAFFLVVVGVISPAHSYATQAMCRVLWPETLLSSITSILYYIYEPFFIYGSVYLLIGLVAIKCGWLEKGVLKEHLLYIQCCSALAQIWLGLYYYVIHRLEGQCFTLITELTILQVLITYAWGTSGETEEKDHDE